MSHDCWVCSCLLSIDLGWADRNLGRNQLQPPQISAWMPDQDRAEGYLPVSGRGKEKTTPLQHQPVSSKGRDHFAWTLRVVFPEQVFGILKAPVSRRQSYKTAIQPMLFLWRGGEHTGIMSLASV